MVEERSHWQLFMYLKMLNYSIKEIDIQYFWKVYFKKHFILILLYQPVTMTREQKNFSLLTSSIKYIIPLTDSCDNFLTSQMNNAV